MASVGGKLQASPKKPPTKQKTGPQYLPCPGCSAAMSRAKRGDGRDLPKKDLNTSEAELENLQKSKLLKYLFVCAASDGCPCPVAQTGKIVSTLWSSNERHLLTKWRAGDKTCIEVTSGVFNTPGGLFAEEGGEKSPVKSHH